MANHLPNHLRKNPFKGELSDEQFQAQFAQNVCYSVLDDSAIIAITDESGAIVYANQAFEKISKYSLDELLGRNHRILNSGYHTRSFFRDMYSHIKVGRKWRGEIRNRAKDGSHYWVDTTIVPILGAREKIIGFASIRIDISARKDAEAACAASEERFRALTSMASDWFWETDSSFRFTDVSAGIALAGIDASFFLGKAPWALKLECEGMSMAEHRDTLTSQKAFREHVYKVKSPDKAEYCWLSLSGRPRFGADRKFLGYRGVGRNITEAFLASRDMREQSELLRTIKRSFPGGLAIVDSNMKIVDSNAQYRKIMQLPDSLFNGGRADLADLLTYSAERGDFGPGDTARLVSDNIERIKSPKSHVHEHMGIDGSIIEIRSAPLRDGGWLKIYVDVTDRKKAQNRIEFLANHDALTSLANRRQLRRDVASIAGRLRSASDCFAMLLLDLDHFKPVNDKYGHSVGDSLLMEVATRLRQCIRRDDTIARIGGDEFAVMMSNVSDESDIFAYAERIIAKLSAPYHLDGRSLCIGASVGVAISPRDGKSADQLLKKADIALYQAKASGRGACRIFDANLQLRIAKRLSVERELRTALERQQFELHYQPQFDIKTLQLSGLEALIRWEHPTKGRISPQAFIPVAEDSGLIEPIGQWVFNTACAAASGLPGHIKMAINVSPAQLRNAKFLEQIDSAIGHSKLAPNRLEIEITETALLHADAGNLTILQSLRDRGFRLALDDFGTGYSSITTLQEFKFDKIKVDKSFVARLPGCSRSLAFVRAMVSLAKALDLSVTAEGIETQSQFELIRAEGCDEAQGYLLGKPKPLAEYAQLLEGAAHILIPPPSLRSQQRGTGNLRAVSH